MERTQVVIVGAGPAGLLLSHLLHLQDVDSVVLERRSRSHVEQRQRAGVLESSTVQVLEEVGLADRLHERAIAQEGFNIRFGGRTNHVDLRRLAGASLTNYPQHELVKDLVTARCHAGAAIHFEVERVTVDGLDGRRPVVRYVHDGSEHVLEAAVVAGCDGFHGVCRPAVRAALTEYDKVYAAAWLGILAEAPPPLLEGTYCWHPEGFSLHSLRGPHLSRQYLQVAPEDTLDRWPEERIWETLRRRADADGVFVVTEGPILERSITPLRAFVAEPMQAGRLYLAGDAAHILPPTGAKGLNLAVADVCVLSRAIGAMVATGRSDELDRYSERCLPRVWRSQRYAARLTHLLHRLGGDGFDQRLQEAELQRLFTTPTALQDLAADYVGTADAPPWEW